MSQKKLQRHGARYPTKSSGEAIQESVEQIQQATSFNNPNLTFIKDYKYTLGTDNLVPFGAAQCVLLPLFSYYLLPVHFCFCAYSSNRVKVVRRRPRTLRAICSSRKRTDASLYPHVK